MTETYINGFRSWPFPFACNAFSLFALHRNSEPRAHGILGNFAPLFAAGRGNAPVGWGKERRETNQLILLMKSIHWADTPSTRRPYSRS